MAERQNKLSGGTWLQYSFSIWRDIQKNPEEWKLKHPAMFPIQLAERLIEIFTNKPGQFVLDPFMGSGSTVIAAVKKLMRGIGFDISKEYCNMAKGRIEKVYASGSNRRNYQIFCDSALNIEKYLKPNSVDLTITSPPYWDILNRRRTADNKAKRNYGDLKQDVSNIPDYENFLMSLQNIFKAVYAVTKPNKYCIVVVMDIRKGPNFYDFHSDVAKKMEQIGFILKDIAIWDRQKEYNNMKPLGYPYSFIVNKVHEYILIFKKV